MRECGLAIPCVLGQLYGAVELDNARAKLNPRRRAGYLSAAVSSSESRRHSGA